MFRTLLTVAATASLFLAGQNPVQAGPNGRLGPAGKGGQGIREEMRKRLDQNGDGKVERQEVAAARQAMQARGLPGKGQGQGNGNGPGREAIMKRFDKDGDGKLNDDERAAARKAMEERKKN